MTKLVGGKFYMGDWKKDCYEFHGWGTLIRGKLFILDGSRIIKLMVKEEWSLTMEQSTKVAGALDVLMATANVAMETQRLATLDSGAWVRDGE